MLSARSAGEEAKAGESGARERYRSTYSLRAGQNGPVVVFLTGAVPGGFDGKVEIKATVTGDNIVNTACGSTIAELVESMRAGNTYVNAHSPAHPGGEVRGQIRED